MEWSKQEMELFGQFSEIAITQKMILDFGNLSKVPFWILAKDIVF